MANKKIKETKVEKEKNIMDNIFLEKVVLNCGATAEKLEKSVKLLSILTNRKINEIESIKRIPTLGVRPGLKTGAMVTIRGKEKIEILKRLFGAVNNKIRKKQIQDNHFSFGIKEYLEIPNMEYQRDIGIIGLDVTVTFSKPGKRVKFKKIKKGKWPTKKKVDAKDIIEFLENKLGVIVE